MGCGKGSDSNDSGQMLLNFPIPARGPAGPGGAPADAALGGSSEGADSPWGPGRAARPHAVPAQRSAPAPPPAGIRRCTRRFPTAPLGAAGYGGGQASAPLPSRRRRWPRRRRPAPEAPSGGACAGWRGGVPGARPDGRSGPPLPSPPPRSASESSLPASRDSEDDSEDLRAAESVGRRGGPRHTRPGLGPPSSAPCRSPSRQTAAVVPLGSGLARLGTARRQAARARGGPGGPGAGRAPPCRRPLPQHLIARDQHVTSTGLARDLHVTSEQSPCDRVLHWTVCRRPGQRSCQKAIRFRGRGAGRGRPPPPSESDSDRPGSDA